MGGGGGRGSALVHEEPTLPVCLHTFTWCGDTLGQFFLHPHMRHTGGGGYCSVCAQVYLPCVLQTKKRYVGYMYESLDQKEPVFDAKGIETVRRDSCPAVSKVTGKPTRLLPLHFYCSTPVTT